MGSSNLLCPSDAFDWLGFTSIIMAVQTTMKAYIEVIKTYYNVNGRVNVKIVRFRYTRDVTAASMFQHRYQDCPKRNRPRLTRRRLYLSDASLCEVSLGMAFACPVQAQLPRHAKLSAVLPERAIYSQALFFCRLCTPSRQPQTAGHRR